MQPDLEQLEAEYERLWLAYNTHQRTPPRCEHVTRWQQQPETTRGDLPSCEHMAVWQHQADTLRASYQAARRALDDAAAMNDAQAASVLSSLPIEPEPASQGALFPLGGAA